jgi:hypothetical protein
MRSLLLAILLSFPALADWEGKVHFTFDPPRPGMGPQSEGAIHVKGGKIRIDQQAPMGKMAIIFDFKTKKLAMLLLDRKQYIEMDKSLSAATVPPVCESGKAAECLSAEGFKKTGSETVDGRKTSIWEQDRDTPMGKIHQKLWVVDGAKELMFLRQVTQSDRGASKTEVTDVKETAQADSLFAVPPDFTKMESPPRGTGHGQRPPGK